MFNSTDESIAGRVREDDFVEKKNYSLELEILLKEVRETVFPEAKK